MKLALWLAVSLAYAMPVVAGDADPRVLVEFPEPMRQHMLSNMRDHLLAVTEIQQALAAGAFDSAANIAEQRLGMSSLNAHGASHMAPFMPTAMQEIGTRMHKAASEFALAAQEAAVDGDLGRPIGALSRITQQCVACHADYRVR